MELRLAMARALLAAGANADARAGRRSHTALHLLAQDARQGPVAVCVLAAALLAAGADPLAANAQGARPLDCCFFQPGVGVAGLRLARLLVEAKRVPSGELLAPVVLRNALRYFSEVASEAGVQADGPEWRAAVGTSLARADLRLQLFADLTTGGEWDDVEDGELADRVRRLEAGPPVK